LGDQTARLGVPSQAFLDDRAAAEDADDDAHDEKEQP
jgi:hypothetical protein